jgi:hypothetical protein
MNDKPTSSKPTSDWRRLYEPWLKSWLILMPIVGAGSYYLTRNAWRRIQAILQGEAGSVWDAPPIPKTAEPASLMSYGIGAALVFSLFWLVIARLYIAAQDSQQTPQPPQSYE